MGRYCNDSISYRFCVNINFKLYTMLKNIFQYVGVFTIVAVITMLSACGLAYVMSAYQLSNAVNKRLTVYTVENIYYVYPNRLYITDENGGVDKHFKNYSQMEKWLELQTLNDNE